MFDLSMNGLALLGVAIAGACVGSFVHVLALRWSEVLKQHPGASLSRAMWGRSECPSCRQALKPWQLLPLLGVLILRGRCAMCGAPIPWRDTLAEVMLAVTWLAMVWVHGWGWFTALWLLWSAVLLLLALIDWDTYLLPDVLTLGLAGVGIGASALGLTGQDLWGSLSGTLLGYVLLATVAWAYRRLRGTEGMGLGDAKLLAALGAWLGPWILPGLLWVSALLGLIWGLTWRWRGRVCEGGAVAGVVTGLSPGAFPFGPSLAGAGVLAAICPEVMLAWMGRW